MIDWSALIPLIPLFALWFDIRRYASDLPQKALESNKIAFESIMSDLEVSRQKESHLLEYIEYLWEWIHNHKPKRVKLPKVFENFKMRKNVRKG